MTTRLLGIVIVIASALFMSVVSLLLRWEDASEPESPDTDGKLTDRRRYSRLNY